MKTDQDFIGRILQPRVRLVQLSGSLAGQLAELVAVGHMRECPKNQVRTHFVFLLQSSLPGRYYLAPPVQ